MSARKTAVTCASAACLAMAVPAVKGYEGYWPVAKVDTVGTGEPCTGGYGSTEGVKCGERHTEKEWADKLQTHLRDDYDAKIGQCIHVELPDAVRAAALSTAYNAGSAAVCRSPMVAKWNAGDLRGGCNAILTKNAKGEYTGWYIRARGRVVQGLVNRRAKERKMCLSGLNGPQTAMTPAGETVHGVYRPWPKGDANKPVDEQARKPAPKPARPWYSWIFK